MRADPSTGDLLALDPSVRSAGVALFRGGVLAAAGTVTDRAKDGDTQAARCLRVAEDVVEWVARTSARPRLLVVEWPQVYRAARSPGDPNDLIGIAGVAMGVAGMLRLVCAAKQEALEVVSVVPAEWAGQLPKTTAAGKARVSPRGSRVESRLGPAELEVWQYVRSHDAVDAIGIGLFILGRFDRVRVFPGAVG